MDLGYRLKMATRIPTSMLRIRSGAPIRSATPTPSRKMSTTSIFGFSYRKLCTRVENSSSHPFRAINSSSLNGMEIILGGSIIMPMDISVEATITSIRTNGMYR